MLYKEREKNLARDSRHPLQETSRGVDLQTWVSSWGEHLPESPECFKTSHPKSCWDLSQVLPQTTPVLGKAVFPGVPPAPIQLGAQTCLCCMMPILQLLSPTLCCLGDPLKRRSSIAGVYRVEDESLTAFAPTFEMLFHTQIRSNLPGKGGGIRGTDFI